MGGKHNGGASGNDRNMRIEARERESTQPNHLLVRNSGEDKRAKFAKFLGVKKSLFQAHLLQVIPAKA